MFVVVLPSFRRRDRASRTVPVPPVSHREAFLRRCGYGVPSLDRSPFSAQNSLTLVVQDTIHPFADGEMREMHVHALPWPTDVLQGLGAVDVRLRVTLSYFVEPNPRSPGWIRRDRYASHGLRFDLTVSRATESLAVFRKRLNQRALAEEEKGPANRQEDGWVLGNFAREKGSLHADVWEGTGAELATRGFVAVFPITGWWKDQPARDRSDLGARYALVVSIEAPGVDIDIWTPVAQVVGVAT